MAKASLFQVSFVPPPALVAQPTEAVPGAEGRVVTKWDTNLVTLSAKRISMPDSTIQTVKAYYFGRAVNYWGPRTYSTLDMTCFTSNNWNAYRWFHRWQRIMNHPEFNTTLTREMNRYKTEVWIKPVTWTQNQVGAWASADPKKTSPVLSPPVYKLIGAYPEKIGAVNLDWSLNETADFILTWCFDHADLTNNNNSVYGALYSMNEQAKRTDPEADGSWDRQFEYSRN